MKKVLASIVPHQAAEYMTSAYEITGFAEAAALLKCLPFHVRGLQGWKKAQVTSGGVSKYEIDPAAMESRLIEGLFFGGEVIDEDHPCGGYNLQHAWETGMICGNAMAAASAGRESEENGKL